jgi:hypothetical protein
MCALFSSIGKWKSNLRHLTALITIKKFIITLVAV